MSPAEAQIMIDEVHARITLYNVIAGAIRISLEVDRHVFLALLMERFLDCSLKSVFLEALLSQRFATPIRPSNANLSVSAFRSG